MITNIDKTDNDGWVVTLWRSDDSRQGFRATSKDEADMIVAALRDAFAQGRAAARAEMRRAMGVER